MRKCDLDIVTYTHERMNKNGTAGNQTILKLDATSKMMQITRCFVSFSHHSMYPFAIVMQIDVSASFL